MLSQDIEIIFTNTAGTQRRAVPREYLLAPSGSILRYGGYGPSVFPTLFDVAEQYVPILWGDRVEVWRGGYLTGYRVYRGYVTGFAPTEGNPRQLTIQANGAAFWVQKQSCNQQWAYPYETVDVCRPFADFANAYLIQTVGPQDTLLFPTANVQAQTVGVPFYSILNAINKQSGEVLADIAKAAANLALWGVDVDDATNNRIYIRPFAATVPPTHTIFVPSRNVTVAHGETQGADVVNSLIVDGGSPPHQQLIHNGQLNLVVPFSAGLGNIILNGDFEVGGQHSDHWVFANGATAEAGKTSSPASASAFTGARYLELDNQGGTESGTQTESFAFVAGHTYWLQFQAAKEIALQLLSGRAILSLLDVSNSVILGPLTVTLYDDGGIGAGRLTQAWQQFVIPFAPPAGAVKYTIEFVLDSISDYGGALGGLTIDGVEMFDTSILYQDGFTIINTPATTINATNWACPVAYRGAYSVYLDASLPIPNIDPENNFDGAQIVPVKGPVDYAGFIAAPTAKFTLNGSTQTLRMSCFAMSPPASFNSPNPGFPGLLLVIDWYDHSGGWLGQSRVYYADPGGTYDDWTYFELIATAPGGAGAGLARISTKTTGSLLVDEFSVTDIAAPSMNPNAGPVTIGGITIPGNPAGPGLYVQEGRFSAVIDCDDPYLLDVYLPGQGKSSSPAYSTSQAQYGVLSTSISEDLIVDQNSLCSIADAVFSSQGLPIQRPTVTVVDDPNDLYPGPYWPGDTMSLQGEAGPSYLSTPAPIVEMGWFAEGLLRFELQIHREKADDTIALVKLMLALIRTNQQGASSGSGGGYNNMGTGGSGSSGGGSALTVTDGVNSYATTKLKFLTGSVSNPVTGEVDYTADHKLIVSADDTTPGYLEDKITVTAPLTKTENTEAGNETLGLAVSNASTSAVGVVQLETDSSDTSASHVVTANDTRLSDNRTPIDGSVTTVKLADDAVTAAKIAAGAVGTSELADDSVTSAKIAADAVGSSEIAAGAVGTSELADDSVTAAKIAADAVGSSEIAAGAVGTSELATDAVTTVKIIDDAITAAKIAAGAVGASEIADGTITDTEIATANKDGLAATPSMRTLGTGAQQAAAGNDSRLSDARTPTLHHTTHESGGSDEVALAASQIASGTLAAARLPAATTAAQGAVILEANSADTSSSHVVTANDTRLSDARTPAAHHTTHESGGGDAVSLDASQITSGTLASARIPNAAGDVSGARGAESVDKIKGTPVSATTPTQGQVLMYDAISAEYELIPLSVLPSVKVCATANRTLSGVPQTIDTGVTINAGDLVLCGGQTTGSQNGPWVAAAGAWTRPTWYAAGATIPAGVFLWVESGGTSNAAQIWYLSGSAAIVVDTTSTTWVREVQPVIAGGTGLTNLALGDLWYGSAATTAARLTGNITTTRKFLRQTGDSANSAAPAWDTIVAGDVPSLDASILTTGTLGTARGGTGLASYAQGDIPYASATNTLASLAKDTNSTRYLSNTGASNAPAWAQVALTTGVSGVLPEANGGTNQSTYAQGDILYASAANTLAKLAKNTTSHRYLQGGNTPSWAQVDLTDGVTGALPATNGGTGQSTLTQGDILYSDASNSLAKLAKNTSSTRYLSNTGTTNNPAWAQIALTTGVSGTLPVGNGGTGAATLTNHGLLIGQATAAIVAMAAGSSGQIVRSGGASADPAWSTATYPATAGTANNVLASDGTNFVSQALPKRRWIYTAFKGGFTPTTGVDLDGMEFAPYGPANASITWVLKQITLDVQVPASGSDTYNVRKSTAGNAAFGTGTDLSTSNITRSGNTNYNKVTNTGFAAVTVASGDRVAAYISAWASGEGYLMAEFEEQ